MEVKHMHFDRIADQMKHVPNVVVAQGRIAVQFLADVIEALGRAQG